MTNPSLTVVNIEEVEHFNFFQMARLCALSDEEAVELVDYGAIKADFTLEQKDYYTPQTLEILKEACQQRRDYDLDLFSVVIGVQYLRQIAELKEELEAYRVLTRESARTLSQDL
jgi:hypothetical protein